MHKQLHRMAFSQADSRKVLHQGPYACDAQECQSTRRKSDPGSMPYIIENCRRQSEPTNDRADATGCISEHAHQHVGHGILISAPFGGVKDSGVGREGGFEAMRFFTEPKNICVALK